MPNSYQSAFTGQHNDAYDARISAVEAYGNRITNLENKLTTYSYDSENNTVTINSNITNVTHTFKKPDHIWSGNGIVLGPQEGHLWMTHDNVHWPIIHNYYNGNVTFNAAGGYVCVGYENSPNGIYLGDANSATKFYITSNGQAQRPGSSSTWIKGRDVAMLRLTSCPSGQYCPIISTKSTNGSWEIGCYNESSFNNRLVFSYGTDANYNNNNNNSVHAFITPAGAFTNASKRELKENIGLINYSCLDIINSIKICSFNMKDDPEKDYRVGFIADDTDERVAGKNHDIMDLQNCIGVLMKAVQELSQEINQLKEQLNK